MLRATTLRNALRRMRMRRAAGRRRVMDLRAKAAGMNGARNAEVAGNGALRGQRRNARYGDAQGASPAATAGFAP